MNLSYLEYGNSSFATLYNTRTNKAPAEDYKENKLSKQTVKTHAKVHPNQPIFAGAATD